MKVRPGDALRMIERTFGPVEIVEWGGKVLKKPTPPVDLAPPEPTPTTVKEVAPDARPALF